MALAIRPNSFVNNVVPAFDDITSAFANAATAERAYQREQKDRATRRRETLEDRKTQRDQALADEERRRAQEVADQRAAADYNMALDRVRAQDKQTMAYQQNLDRWAGMEQAGLVEREGGVDPDAVYERSLGAVDPMDVMQAQGQRRVQDSQIAANNALAGKRTSGTSSRAGAGGGEEDPGYGLSAEQKRYLDMVEPEVDAEMLRLRRNAGYAVDARGELVLDDMGKPVVADPVNHASTRNLVRGRLLRARNIDPVTFHPLASSAAPTAPAGSPFDLEGALPGSDLGGAAVPGGTDDLSTVAVSEILSNPSFKGDLDAARRKLEAKGIKVVDDTGGTAGYGDLMQLSPAYGPGVSFPGASP